MTLKYVSLEKDGKFGWLTLNRPDKLNAFNDELWGELKEAMATASADPDMWIIIIKGAGRSFSVGQDLSGTGTSQVMPPEPRTKPYISDIFESDLRRLHGWRAIFDIPRFTIAMVHGYCLGMGAELAMVCKAVISTEDAVFGDPSIRMGYSSPNPLWTWKVGLKKAKDLLLTGKYIDGKEAERIGLVMKAVPSDILEETVRHEAEARLATGTIGGFDSQIGLDITLSTNMDITGLAAAWGSANFLHSLSTIQRPGRSYLDRSGFDFYKIREEKGLKAAIEARDAPFRKYFPQLKPNS